MKAEYSIYKDKILTKWLAATFILGFSLLSLYLGSCASAGQNEPYGIIVETTDSKAILNESLVGIEITALVKNSGASGSFVINALLTPEGHESLQESKDEYFSKDAERHVIFTFTLKEDIEYSYRVWISRAPTN